MLNMFKYLMHLEFRKQEAFTLSEVLITLVVIGVIAVITIPTIIAYYNEEQTRTALQKNYTVLRNALEMIRTFDGDDYRDWSTDSHSIAETKSIANKLKTHLNVEKMCYHTSGCFPDKVYYLNKTTMGRDNEVVEFVLADGTLMRLDIWGGGTLHEYKVFNSWDYTKYSNPIFFIDINGLKKPNTIGKDVFLFVISETKGLIPGGYDTKAKYCNSSYRGLDCAVKYFKN